METVRPMKLAGQELMFGEGSLAHLKTLQGERALIVTGGSSMEKSGVLQAVQEYLKAAGIESRVFSGVEADPSFSTIKKGAAAMKEWAPDLIVGLGGGSAMDAAKAMRIYYEHPHLSTLEDILPPNPFPKLGKKAKVVCIPSTSGTASEVSRSVVITDDETEIKHGLGNMEMMPEIAICDPAVTVTMPPKITAETGMDALTHALEALVSQRANYLSDILAFAAAEDILINLPRAYAEGNNMASREIMLNASFTAGIAFTNVSLGIVHSMAHALGSGFNISHGLANATLLPFVMEFNLRSKEVKERYARLGKAVGSKDLIATVREMNENLGIPSLKKLVAQDAFQEKLDFLSALALKDGCTKTNPVIPTVEELKTLFLKGYEG